MMLFKSKIPRGKLYHSLINSFKYLLWSMIKPLDHRKYVVEFEKQFSAYTGQHYCVAFPFARTSVHALLKSRSFPVGSEVLLPAVTIKGMVDVVLDLDLVPVYVDSDPDTFCFSLDDLGKKVSEKTVAALVTPLFGLVPDMESLCDHLESENIFTMVDFSQCLNGKYKGRNTCDYGDAAIYSASSIKTLDTLGGGFIVTNSEVLHSSLKVLQEKLTPVNRLALVKKAWINLTRNIATQNIVFSYVTFYAIRLLSFVNREGALKMTGGRSKTRLTSLPEIWFAHYSSVQAEIGLYELGRVEKLDAKRINFAESIKSEFPKGRFPVTTPFSDNVYWQLVVIVKDAKAVQDQLAKKGVDSATSSLELVSKLEFNPVKFTTPAADNLYSNALIIPCFPSMSPEGLLRVKQCLLEVLRDE